MTAQESPLPQRVRRVEEAPFSQVLPRMSLARIEDRLSSTESAVDMMAATVPVSTTTAMTRSQADSSAQRPSRRGMT